MSLSSLIVQREIATIREVEEALARQVLYGGDLVTNLLEVTRLEESKITPLLAESFGMQAGPIGELPAPAEGTKTLVPLELATARAMIPLARQGKKLVVAVSEPLAKDVEEELAFALGLGIEQRIAPSFRVRQAISREYSVPLERRVQRLLSRISGEDARMSSSLPPLLRDPPRAIEPPKTATPQPPAARLSPHPPVAAVAPPEKRSRTISGMPAVSADTHIAEAKAPALTPQAGTPIVRDPKDESGGKDQKDPKGQSADSDAKDPKIQTDAKDTTTPPGSLTDPAPPPRTMAEARAPKIDEPFESPGAAPISARAAAVRRASLQRQAAVVPGGRARRRRGPLTPDAAYDQLDEAGDRDAILNLFFDFSRQYFDYSALFIVQSDLAEGRDAYGDGAGRERVVTIGVPLDIPSVLSRARDRAAPISAVPGAEGLDAVLMSDLGRSARGAVLVAPVVVRKRVVALLFGDSGDAGVDEAARKEVEAFAQGVGQAFERLIVKKKLGTSKASEKSAPRSGKVEPAKVPSKQPRYTPPPTVLSPRAQSFPPPSAAEPAVIEVQRPILDSPSILGAPPIEPPPSNLFQVRKPSGKPIPREEPERIEEGARAGSHGPTSSHAPPDHTKPSVVLSDPPPTTVDVRGEAHKKRGEENTVVLTHATIAQAALAGAHADADRAEAEERAAQDQEEAAMKAQMARGEVEYPEPTDQDTVVLEVEPPPPPPPKSHPSAPGSEVGSQPPASSGQAISVPAHRPPSSRVESSGELPSIIVDVRAELAMLVERFLSPGGDEQAEGELLRQGQTAMPAIMERFPGPITADPERIAAILRSTPTKEAPLRVSECGPLLRLVAGQRRVALPSVLKKIADDDSEHRFWATFLLTELIYPESAERIVPRLFDEELRTRKVARLAARALAEVAPNAIIEHLADIALASRQASNKRVSTVDIFGEMREPAAVPVLVSLLQDGDELVAQAAHLALVTVTRQDFGTDPRRWLGWWSTHSAQHRIEWLIDALMHDEARLRQAAGEELKAITKEYFGYYDDLPRRERERAQQRYRDWWSTEGRVRFRRT